MNTTQDTAHNITLRIPYQGNTAVPSNQVPMGPVMHICSVIAHYRPNTQNTITMLGLILHVKSNGFNNYVQECQVAELRFRQREGAEDYLYLYEVPSGRDGRRATTYFTRTIQIQDILSISNVHATSETSLVFDDTDESLVQSLEMKNWLLPYLKHVGNICNRVLTRSPSHRKGTENMYIRGKSIRLKVGSVIAYKSTSNERTSESYSFGMVSTIHTIKAINSQRDPFITSIEYIGLHSSKDMEENTCLRFHTGVRHARDAPIGRNYIELEVHPGVLHPTKLLAVFNGDGDFRMSRALM